MIERDQYSNRRTIGGNTLSLSISFSGAASSQIQSQLPVDNNDGSYLISYVPIVEGDMTVSVQYGGEDISNSPFP
eukprot:3735237-Rhodomonas_salina.1